MEEKTRPTGEHRATPVDDNGNLSEKQHPVRHGVSEEAKTTPDGRVLVPVGPEGQILQVRSENLPSVLTNQHQAALEKEQGITYKVEDDSKGNDKLVGVKK